MQTLKRILFVAVLFLPFSIHADSTSIFGAALDKLRSLRGSKSNCLFCISARDPEELSPREKCVAQLCPLRAESDETVTAEARKAFEKDPEADKLRKLVLDTLLLQMEKKRTNDQYLLKALQQNLEFTIPETKVLALHLKSVDNLKDFVRADASGEYDLAEIRKALVSGKRAQEEIDFLMPYLEKFLKKLNDPNEKFSDYDDLKKNLSENDLRNRLTTGYKEHLEAIKKMAAISGLPKDAIYSPSNIHEDAQSIMNGTMSEGRFDDIKMSSIMIRLKLDMLASSSKWLRDGGKKIRLRDLLPPDIEERLKGRIAVTDKIMAKDYAESDHPYRMALDRVYGKCISALREGYAMSPDENQLTEFKKTESAYRREFAEKMKRFLSAKSAAELRKAVEKWNAQFPPVRSEFLSRFKERIASEGEIVSVGELAKNAYGTTTEFAALELAEDTDLKNDDDYFDSMNEVCTREVPQAYGDLSRLKKERVTVSSRTVTRPDYAKQILFHEYGHLMSSMIFKDKNMSKETKEWRNNFLSCLEKQRGSRKAFNEEDFVQSLAIALAGGAADFNCHKDISWTEDRNFKLNDDAHDKDHSGAMYNLVLGIFARGADFSDCRKAFTEAGEKEIPESCFDKTAPASTAQ